MSKHTAEARQRNRARQRMLERGLGRLKWQQESILGELPSATQRALKMSGFTPRVRPVHAPKKTGGTIRRWPWPGPPVTAKITGRTKQTSAIVTPDRRLQVVRTGTFEGGIGQAGSTAVKSVLRHEIGHQILKQAGIPSQIHHKIAQAKPRGTKAGTRLLATLTEEFKRGTTKLRKGKVGSSEYFFDRPALSPLAKWAKLGRRGK